MPTSSEIHTLHRYYIWADRMRVLFYQVPQGEDAHLEREFPIESFLYMSYWYGGLYVVIEGWNELGLSDTNIDSLLQSGNVDLLRRYRNGVFHFQKDYFDERFAGFIRDGTNCVEWIRQLNTEFGRFFLAWYDKMAIKPSWLFTTLPNKALNTDAQIARAG